MSKSHKKVKKKARWWLREEHFRWKELKVQKVQGWDPAWHAGGSA